MYGFITVATLGLMELPTAFGSRIAVPILMSADLAKDYCVSEYGGHLVSFHDDCEYERVLQMCEEVWNGQYGALDDSVYIQHFGEDNSRRINNYCWIGLVAADKWHDGSLLDYIPSGFSNPPSTTQCMALQADNSPSWMHGSSSCGETGYFMPFICEIEDTSPTPAPTTNCPKWQYESCECKDYELAVNQHNTITKLSAPPIFTVTADNAVAFYLICLLAVIGLCGYPFICAWS
mmetsp:Transcript_73284/g.116811  ORF Transcript_73284/g.116811 Transcript_73284/m.116811 type:complete len:234 (-) Transcript_73284:11-712(-)